MKMEPAENGTNPERTKKLINALETINKLFGKAIDRSSKGETGNENVDGVRRDIDKESERAQRELERERRSKSHSPRRDSKSPTRTMLSLAPNTDKSYEKPVNQQQDMPNNITVSSDRSSPVLTTTQDSGYRTPPRHRSMSPRHHTSSTGGKPSYLQESPRSSSDYQEDSPRLSFSQDNSSPLFHELPRSSSPSPPRDMSSRDNHRSSSPSPRGGIMSLPESPINNSASSDNPRISHTPYSYGTSSLLEPSQKSDVYEDLSVLRARSLSPKPQEAHSTSPRQSAMKDSSYRSPSPRPSKEVSENSNSRKGSRGSEDKLSVSFQDQLPPQSQRHSRSQSTEYPRQLDSPHSRNRLLTRRASDSEIDSSDETKTSKVEFRSTERKLKNLRAQTEDARTQLMLTEFKRDNMLKDYERMSEDLLRKKRELKEFEDQMRSRKGDVRYQNNFSVMSDEKTHELTSENESLKHRMRQMDGLELERDELVRQLELTKEELFNEQRKSRNQIEELKEEIENLTMQIEEGRDGSDLFPPSSSSELQQKLHRMEEAFKRMEKEKNEVIREKTKLYEDLRQMSQNPRAEAKKLVSREVEELQNEVAELCRKVGMLQSQVNQKEENIESLGKKNSDLKQQLSKEKSVREGLLEDHRRTLQTLRKDMDGAMVQMREKLFLDKQQALETLRCNLEEERREAMSRADDKLTHHLTDHIGVIKAKEDEISRLIDLVKRMEDERRETERRTREELKEEIQTSIHRERKSLQSEHMLQMSREREQLEQEAKLKIRNLNNELDQEKQLRESMDEQIQRMRKDLEDQKQHNKQAIHDRMIAVARAKDQIRNEMTKELEKVKEKLKADHKREIDKLQDTIRSQEEEIRKMRAERIQWQQYERQNTSSMDRMERSLINEANEECRKTAGMLGSRNLASFPDSQNMYGRSPTNAALANLRACNQELRNFVHDLKQELEYQKSTQTRSHREKDEMVQQLKNKLEREKNMELEKLKEKLTKGSGNEYREKVIYPPNNDLAASMQYGLPPKVPSYEFHPRSEMQQKEIDRLEREIKGLAMHQNRMMTPNNMVANDNINAAKMINHLESKLSQLQFENNALRSNKFSFNSVPDLANPVYYQTARSPVSMVRAPTPQQERMMSVLEQRAKVGEYESDLAAEQQERSRNMMSQKMGDMTKLQNTLTNQAKELIQLSRSYSNLNSTYPSPRMNNVR